MADGSIDVLMRVVGPKGPFEAESSTQFGASPDSLRLGFMSPEFCELREFSFSAGVAAAMSDKQKDAARFEKARKKAEKEKEREGQDTAPMSAEELRMESSRKILKRQDKRLAKRDAKEVIDMQPVEFTRTMDCMSTLLFQSLVKCDTLQSISVIKRKAAGVASSGLTYLRLDFNKVLMTDLSWKDSEHVIIETGTFIYRSVTIRYRPQRPDGTLGSVIQQEWTMKTAADMR